MGRCNTRKTSPISQAVMEYKKIKAQHKEFTFLIEEDFPEVGVYMYINKNGEGFRDELQDSIDICKRRAHREYRVPLDAWEEVK